MDNFCFLVPVKIGICGYQRYPHPKLSKRIPVNTHPNQVYIIFPFKRVPELLIDRKTGAGFDVVQPYIASILYILLLLLSKVGIYPVRHRPNYEAFFQSHAKLVYTQTNGHFLSDQNFCNRIYALYSNVGTTWASNSLKNISAELQLT